MHDATLFAAVVASVLTPPVHGVQLFGNPLHEVVDATHCRSSTHPAAAVHAATALWQSPHFVGLQEHTSNDAASVPSVASAPASCAPASTPLDAAVLEEAPLETVLDAAVLDTLLEAPVLDTLLEAPVLETALEAAVLETLLEAPPPNALLELDPTDALELAAEVALADDPLLDVARLDVPPPVALEAAARLEPALVDPPVAPPPVLEPPRLDVAPLGPLAPASLVDVELGELAVEPPPGDTLPEAVERAEVELALAWLDALAPVRLDAVPTLLDGAPWLSSFGWSPESATQANNARHGRAQSPRAMGRPRRALRSSSMCDLLSRAPCPQGEFIRRRRSAPFHGETRC